MSLNHSRRLGLLPPAQVPVATHAVDVAQGDELVGVLRQVVVAPRGVQPLVVLLHPSQAGRCRRDQRLEPRRLLGQLLGRCRSQRPAALRL